MNEHNSAARRAPRIALAVGDTAGHAYPALAVAEAFRERDPDASILFLGTADSIAARILAREGEGLVPVPGAPLRGAGLLGVGLALNQTVGAVNAARRLFTSHGTRFAMGFGGFASGGVLLAARTLGIRTAIHEANVEPGLANLFLWRLVDHVYRTHAETDLDGEVVGLPIRREIDLLGSFERGEPNGVLRILVMSGSRGTHFLAAVVPQIVDMLRQRNVAVEVKQQMPSEFLDRMGDVYRWADVAIARAGASSVGELALAGLPAILVPLADAAANHQAANARRWTLAGAGPQVDETRWNAAFVVEWLQSVATNPASWRRASAAARSLAQFDAAQRLVDHCSQAMDGQW